MTKIYIWSWYIYIDKVACSDLCMYVCMYRRKVLGIYGYKPILRGYQIFGVQQIVVFKIVGVQICEGVNIFRVQFFGRFIKFGSQKNSGSKDFRYGQKKCGQNWWGQKYFVIKLLVYFSLALQMLGGKVDHSETSGELSELALCVS